MQCLPVPPPHVRPSVAFDGVNRGDDDLTHKYASIIKANNALLTAKKGNAPEVKMVSFENLLQYEVATLIDNSIQGQGVDSQRSGRPLKTIRERLVGKGGRIRGNLMGKRVDFSGRTVITADPNLSIEQVGVPRSIALNLTVPERVTRHNFEKLERLVANGPKVHPGGTCLFL
jgi:DNA-directed RNA polymerase II subunit RPB1